MSPTVQRGISVLVSIFVLLFVGGCKEKEARKPKEKVIRVEVREVSKKALKPYIEAVGTLDAYDEVIVSAEAEGILKSVKVKEGSHVRNGQLIAGIQDVEFDLEVKRGEASLKQAQASLLNIQLEYERKSALIKDELITKQQFDDVSTRLALAQA
ncbi:MAG: biotin/lipoyl-binding protein [Nitrospirae bacterium]|nr:biotin/lipoyl-binding protein [Nitrospirota bacterium]